jgi:hypothetical protein
MNQNDARPNAYGGAAVVVAQRQEQHTGVRCAEHAAPGVALAPDDGAVTGKTG